MAWQVQVASAIQSESSASSQTPSHAEPLRRNRSRSRDSPYEGGSQQLVSSRSQSGSRAESPLSSHRGPGSLTALEDRQGSGGGLPPTGQPVTLVRQHDQRSVVRNRHQHVQAQDQRSVHQHVHQHAYDQRSMQVQVGMDPVAVIQHVQGVERHAHAAIHEARSEVTSTQRLADQAVQNIVQEARTHVSEVQAQAQVQVQSVETRAQAIVSDMETIYQREMAQIQDTAQRAYEESQHRLLQIEDRNRELLAIIESQSQALESQKDEQRTLMNHVGSLQSEVTMLRHSSVQYDVQVQDQNGAVDVPGLMQMMNSLKDEIKVLKGKHTRKKKHESYVDGRVAVPPEQALSACAGYPPSQDPSPAHSMHSRHSKEPQKPVTAPQMFSLSTYSYFGDASTIGLPGSSTQQGQDPPPDDSSLSSSSSSDRHGGGGGSPDRGRGPPHDDSPASSGLGRLRGGRIHPSLGVGSAVVFDEAAIYNS